MRSTMCSNSTFLVDSDFAGDNDCSRLEDDFEQRRSAMVVAYDILLTFDSLDKKLLNSLKAREQKSLRSPSF